MITQKKTTDNPSIKLPPVVLKMTFKVHVRYKRMKILAGCFTGADKLPSHGSQELRPPHPDLRLPGLVDSPVLCGWPMVE